MQNEPKTCDFPLPHYFDDGLKFGDPAQINYVKTLRAEYEEEEQMIEEGMVHYRVYVRVEGEYYQDVWATCEEEAINQVQNQYDIDNFGDFDVEYDGCKL